MKLTVIERLTILGILPGQSDRNGMLLIRGVKEKVDFSPEEKKKIDLVFIRNPVDPNSVKAKWDEKKNLMKQIQFTEAEHTILMDQFDVADRAKEIDVSRLSTETKLKTWKKPATKSGKGKKKK